MAIVFVKPEEFTDVKESTFGSDRERTALLGDMQKFIRQTSERFLPEGTRLDLKITNVDMAGEFEPWRGAQFDDIRIIKDIYPPRIDLEFRLLDGSGKVLKEGKRELRDMAFMMRIAVMPRDDQLRYEKELLLDWLRAEFRDWHKKA